MRRSTQKLALSALFLSLGILLPFLTGQIPKIGSMLLPMHIPVLLCGFICGWPYGLAVGFITPLFRSLLFGVPAPYPQAPAMALELAAYGLIVGLLYQKLPKKPVFAYLSLLAAMLGGRMIWGAASALLYGAGGNAFTLTAFISGAFLNSIPGMLLQILFVPTVVIILEKAIFSKYGRSVSV